MDDLDLLRLSNRMLSTLGDRHLYTRDFSVTKYLGSHVGRIAAFSEHTMLHRQVASERAKIDVENSQLKQNFYWACAIIYLELGQNLSRGPPMAHSKRWNIAVTYRLPDGNSSVEHGIEELEELQDLIEMGPNWNAIQEIRISLSRVSEPNLTTTLERFEASDQVSTR